MSLIDLILLNGALCVLLGTRLSAWILIPLGPVFVVEAIILTFSDTWTSLLLATIALILAANVSFLLGAWRSYLRSS